MTFIAAALAGAAAGGVVAALVSRGGGHGAAGGAARRPLFTAEFWSLTIERTLKSAAQAVLLTVGAGRLDVLTADWRTLAGAAGGAAVLCLLTCLVSSPFGPEGSPSLVAAPPLTPPAG